MPRSSEVALQGAFTPVGVSSDGTTVIGNVGDTAIAYDITSATTTLLSRTQDVEAKATSTDGRFVLLASDVPLRAGDPARTLNGLFYLLDRTTKELTLATDAPVTLPSGATPTPRYAAVRLSGDGRFVNYWASGERFTNGQREFVSDQWRFDRVTGRSTKLSPLPIDTYNNDVARTDRTGRVWVSLTFGAYVDGKPLALPNVTWSQSVVSDDGSAIALQARDATSATIVNTSTGASITTAVPSWLATAGWQLLGVGNGGSGFLVSTRLTRTAGTRDAIGWISRSGTLTQVGGDVPTTSTAAPLVVSGNAAWAANGYAFARLTPGAVAGVDPGGSTPATFAQTINVGDTSCQQNLVGPPTQRRAWVQLRSGSVGDDPRAIARGTFRVFNTANPATIYNAFSISAGQSRELTVPRTGGWTVSGTVTFTDGSTITGTRAIAPHPVAPCLPVFIG